MFLFKLFFRTAQVVRQAIDSCTGNGGLSTEDTRDYCQGWRPLTSENCTQADEYESVFLLLNITSCADFQ